MKKTRWRAQTRSGTVGAPLGRTQLRPSRLGPATGTRNQRGKVLRHVDSEHRDRQWDPPVDHHVVLVMFAQRSSLNEMSIFLSRP